MLLSTGTNRHDQRVGGRRISALQKTLVSLQEELSMSYSVRDENARAMAIMQQQHQEDERRIIGLSEEYTGSLFPRMTRG